MVTRKLPGAAGRHDCVVGDPPPVDGVEGVLVGAVGVAAASSPPLQPVLNAATSAAAAQEKRIMPCDGASHVPARLNAGRCTPAPAAAPGCRRAYRIGNRRLLRQVHRPQPLETDLFD